MSAIFFPVPELYQVIILGSIDDNLVYALTPYQVGVYLNTMTREFIFMPEFERQWKNCGLNDDNLKDLEAHLCEHPEEGKLIQGTGGLRKFRWALPSKGKSGGSRVLYVDFAFFEKIFMITCFSKNVKVSLSSEEKNQIRSVIEEIKRELRSKKS